MKKILNVLILSLAMISCQQSGSDAIQPYSENPAYWQYKGRPVLLLGASNNDNLFQSPDMEKQLDDLASVGGNFIRCTMSSRDSADVWPFLKLLDGRYDLDQWSTEYWSRFSKLLKLACERDIIVQIEVWDRFDYSREPWQVNPFNPKMNINYSAQQCGMDEEYPIHPYRDLQPFFHAICGMPNYKPELDLVRKYQEKLVDKMLSYTLKYDNVLYCMNNETSTPPEWGRYWMDYIEEKAKAKRKKVYVTDMFDHAFRPRECVELHDALEMSDQYTFLDASQNNSRNFNQAHWDTLQWILEQRNQYPIRPVNNTKVYGGPANRGIFGNEIDGVEKYCRNILAGCASVRFHRPPSGNGLNELTMNVIKSFRIAETELNFWDMKPKMDLLRNRESDEAYVSTTGRGKFLIYFTEKGSVQLDLSDYDQSFEITWIQLEKGDIHSTLIFKGHDWEDIDTPGEGGWLAMILSK